jgi:DHA1 family inner membrane transport protein
VIDLLGIGIASASATASPTIYFAPSCRRSTACRSPASRVPLAIFALGNIAGTVLGGQLADRLRDRLRTFAMAMALSAIAALALFLWHPDAVDLGRAGRRLQPAQCARPAVLHGRAGQRARAGARHRAGLNGATASVGWIGAAALGALMISTVGFEGFGPLAALLGVLGAAARMAAGAEISI